MNPQITPATVAGPQRPVVASESAQVATPADAIAEAIAGLSRLDFAPTRSHVGAFERVHVALTDALASIDGV